MAEAADEDEGALDEQAESTTLYRTKADLLAKPLRSEVENLAEESHRLKQRAWSPVSVGGGFGVDARGLAEVRKDRGFSGVSSATIPSVFPAMTAASSGIGLVMMAVLDQVQAWAEPKQGGSSSSQAGRGFGQ